MTSLSPHTTPQLQSAIRKVQVAADHLYLAEEVPVAMVFDGTSAAVMMASATDLQDFAMGFALTEGFITSFDDIKEFELVSHDNGLEARFWLNPGQSQALARRRRAMAGPIGCGLCGIDSLAEAIRPLPQLASKDALFTQAQLIASTERLRAHQPLHDITHAMHAAAFLGTEGDIVTVREDVGRHNALDKLIGALAWANIDPTQGAFVMTSRVSVELIQKSALAGCPVLVAVSAPTALAVDTARQAGVTLIAMARRGGGKIFSHPHRVLAADLSEQVLVS
jgi:FdhD protein